MAQDGNLWVNTPPLNHQLSDQFAFRPTGSTTAALISILQQSTSFLKHEPRTLCIPFLTRFSSIYDVHKKITFLTPLPHVHMRPHGPDPPPPSGPPHTAHLQHPPH